MEEAAIFRTASPGSIIQCYLHPAIPWQVAPQQSLASVSPDMFIFHI
jgi:hypothetical protein